MKIETMRFSDLEDVMLLANAHFATPWHVQGQTIARLIQRYPALQLVARHDGRLLGYIGCTDTDADHGSGRGVVAQVKGFVVLPSERGKGIGRQLVTCLCQRLRRQGYQRLGAHTTGDVAGYYLKLGFRVTGRTETLALPVTLGIPEDPECAPIRVRDVASLLQALPRPRRQAFIDCVFSAHGTGEELSLCLRRGADTDAVVIAERLPGNPAIAEVTFIWTRSGTAGGENRGERLLRPLNQLVRQATMRTVRYLRLRTDRIGVADARCLRNAGWTLDLPGIAIVDVYLATDL